MQLPVLKAVRQFLSDLTAPVDAGRGPPDEQLAAAALLFHVVAIDGVVSAEERAKLREVLRRRFDLDEESAEDLIGAARQADLEAVDLYGFTSVLKARLDAAGRERVIEMMWEMVFADGEVHEFEDNVVWRVAELLGVSGRDRIRLKKLAGGSAGET